MKKTLLVSSILAATLSSHVQATDINFSGYGSIRGGLLVNDDIVPLNFGYDDKIDFKNESLFALQAKASLNDKWSATMVLQARGEDDFDVKARWAYLSYQLSPDTTISFGRFALPYFRNSDTQDIGYSHNYSRLPKTVYTGQEFDSIEGVRVMHDMLVGDGELSIKSSFGSFDGIGRVFNNTIEFDNIFQFSVDYTYEWFSVFAGMFTTDTTVGVNYDALFTATLPGYSVVDNVVYNPNNIAVYNMNELYANEDSTLYWSTGFTIDYGNWLFNTEYAAYDIDDALTQEIQAMYVSLGYRFDKAVVSFTHQDLSVDYDYSHANASDPFVNGFITGFTDAVYMPVEHDAQGIHLRYDAAEGVAYKFEFTRFNYDQSGESADMVTFGVDFIY